MKKLINDFESIETITDLKKRNLTPSDFYCLEKILKELWQTKKSEFISEGVKNYLEKFKMKIKNHGVGWIVTI